MIIVRLQEEDTRTNPDKLRDHRRSLSALRATIPDPFRQTAEIQKLLTPPVDLQVDLPRLVIVIEGIEPVKFFQILRDRRERRRGLYISPTFSARGSLGTAG